MAPLARLQSADYRYALTSDGANPSFASFASRNRYSAGFESVQALMRGLARAVPCTDIQRMRMRMFCNVTAAANNSLRDV